MDLECIIITRPAHIVRVVSFSLSSLSGSYCFFACGLCTAPCPLLLGGRIPESRAADKNVVKMY